MASLACLALPVRGIQTPDWVSCPGADARRAWGPNVEFLRAQVASSCECVATYSVRLVAARLFIWQQQLQHSSKKLCS